MDETESWEDLTTWQDDGEAHTWDNFYGRKGSDSQATTRSGDFSARTPPPRHAEAIPILDDDVNAQLGGSATHAAFPAKFTSSVEPSTELGSEENIAFQKDEEDIMLIDEEYDGIKTPPSSPEIDDHGDSGDGAQALRRIPSHDKPILSIEDKTQEEPPAHIEPLPIPVDTDIITRDMFRAGYKHDEAQAKALREKAQARIEGRVHLYQNVWQTYMNIPPEVQSIEVWPQTAVHDSCSEGVWRLNYTHGNPLFATVGDSGRALENTHERRQVLQDKTYDIYTKIFESSASLQAGLRDLDWDRILLSVSDACEALNTILLPTLARIAECTVVMWPRAFEFLVMMSCAGVWKWMVSENWNDLERLIDLYNGGFPEQRNKTLEQRKRQKRKEDPNGRQNRETQEESISEMHEYQRTARRMLQVFEEATKALSPDESRASSRPGRRECHFLYDGRVIRTSVVDADGTLLSTSLRFNGRDFGPTDKPKPEMYDSQFGVDVTKSSSRNRPNVPKEWPVSWPVSTAGLFPLLDDSEDLDHELSEDGGDEGSMWTDGKTDSEAGAISDSDLMSVGEQEADSTSNSPRRCPSMKSPEAVADYDGYDSYGDPLSD